MITPDMDVSRICSLPPDKLKASVAHVDLGLESRVSGVLRCRCKSPSLSVRLPPLTPSIECVQVKDEVIASHVAEIEWLTEQLDLAQERALARESHEAEEHDSDQKRLRAELDAAHAAADVAKQVRHPAA